MQRASPCDKIYAMRDGALKTGDVLKGRYTISAMLGQGAYGVVYVADDLTISGAQWAIKEIWEGSLSTEERQEALLLFRKEFEILRSLNHTGVPKVVDCFSDGPRHYMVMERVEGRTLEKILEDGAPELRSVITWALRICDILEHLHSLTPSPLIFRDLKPSNVMLTSRGRILLVDFGIARFFNPEKSRDTCELGTPGFCSPEQYGTCQSDVRSDIYSLGATVYHLLCREDLAQYNFKIPPIRRFNASVPDALERILAKCLEVDPGSRYQSVKDLRVELQSVESRLSRISATQGPQVAPAAITPQHSLLNWLKAVPLPVAIWLLFFFCLIMGPFTIVSLAAAFLVFLSLPIVSLALLPKYIRQKLFFHLVIAILSIVVPVLIIALPFLFDSHSGGKELAGCRSNLKNLGTALELYSTDNSGRYPASLAMLTPQYMKSVPTCPSRNYGNYSYTQTAVPDLYTVWCGGRSHSSQGIAENFPEYDAVKGLVERAAGFSVEDPPPKSADRSVNPYSPANLAACRANLKNIGTAVEMYRTDNQYRSPKNLNSLVPKYLPYLPVCPSAGAATYMFNADDGEDSYTVWCSGAFHADVTKKANFPQYDSVQGIR